MTMHKFLLISGLGAGWLAACAWLPPPQPVPEPDPISDAGPHDTIAAACLRAEAVVCRLDCRDASGQTLCVGPTGVRFGARCRDEVRRGVPWDWRCLGTVTRCEDLDAAATGALCADGGTQ